ncbi:Hypothetical protein SMAX5B_001228 [Scophthalmus maximus]|uniref:Uncharacterized protein n=1 Tax=Scophthalmus maximus TaxID=52904 RepID=A0A2U9B924_SCOMX|nr:Hypothetical protein SMAX5B_001228 [Scophthalmus maximus]KAF0021412.1 hypothetical protein F2P81_026335 [Scophthalmus maximus]
MQRHRRRSSGSTSVRLSRGGRCCTRALKVLAVCHWPTRLSVKVCLQRETKRKKRMSGEKKGGRSSDNHPSPGRRNGITPPSAVDDDDRVTALRSEVRLKLAINQRRCQSHFSCTTREDTTEQRFHFGFCFLM